MIRLFHVLFSLLPTLPHKASAAAEERVAEMNRTTEEFRVQMEARVASLREEISSLREQLTVFDREVCDMVMLSCCASLASLF